MRSPAGIKVCLSWKFGRHLGYIKHVSYPKIIRGIMNMHLHSGKDENTGWSIFIQAMASTLKIDHERTPCLDSSVRIYNTAEEVSIGLDYSEVNNALHFR